MKTVYELVLEEIERIVKIKGGRGFGPGAVYKPAGPKSKLGKSFVEYEMEELEYVFEEVKPILGLNYEMISHSSYIHQETKGFHNMTWFAADGLGCSQTARASDFGRLDSRHLHPDHNYMHVDYDRHYDYDFNPGPD